MLQDLKNYVGLRVKAARDTQRLTQEQLAEAVEKTPETISKPRHVVLTDEGRTFFDTATAGKIPDDLILTRDDGGAWAKSHQQRPFKEVCKAAKLGDLTFHELRHTYASRLVMNGAPLAVVAAQLGHSDS